MDSLLHRVRRTLTAALCVATAASLVGVGSAFAGPAGSDRWTPAISVQGHGFATFDLAWSDGQITTSTVAGARLPMRFAVEQELVSRVGRSPIDAGVTAWNGISGSRFAAYVDRIVEDRVRSPSVDGVNRIFYEGHCPDGAAGHAYLQDIRSTQRYGAKGGATGEVDIGLCEVLFDHPGTVENVVRHEVGHALGLGHLHGTCRVMSERADPCQRLDDGDRDGVRYLYPALPRLAGPTRLETSAWTSYATRQNDAAADAVVLVDAHGGSARAVAAAALAGAIDAPLLLTAADDCMNSATGQELRRVADDDVTIVSVGVDQGCIDQLTGSGARVVASHNVNDIADMMAEERRVETILVVRGPDRDGQLPDGLTAAAVGGMLDAPLLFADGDELARTTVDFLDRHPRIREAVIVGGPAAVPEQVADQLQSRGLQVRRAAGHDRIATALAVADLPGVFPERGPVLIAGYSAWPDTVSAAAIGGSRGWPVLLTPTNSLDLRVGQAIAQRATGGYVLGGTAVVSNRAFLDLNARVG